MFPFKWKFIAICFWKWENSFATVALDSGGCAFRKAVPWKALRFAAFSKNWPFTSLCLQFFILRTNSRMSNKSQSLNDHEVTIRLLIIVCFRVQSKWPTSWTFPSWKLCLCWECIWQKWTLAYDLFAISEPSILFTPKTKYALLLAYLEIG